MTIRKEIKLIILFFLILFGALLFFINSNKNKDLNINYLNVGQGDATLIKTPFGQNILIDGGPDDKVLDEMGRLLSWNDKVIDLMVLTHPHDDHVTGLISALERYEIKKIIYTGVAHTSPNYLKWLQLIKEKHISMAIGIAPQKINIGPECYLEIVYPFQNQDLSQEELNNTSMVINLVYGNTNFLFTGDIHSDKEEMIAEKYPNWNVDVLKIAHHGSNTSTSDVFLNALKPKIGIIFVGLNNPFNHPEKRVINRLLNQKIKIFRTDKDGTISIFSNGKEIYKKILKYL